MTKPNRAAPGGPNRRILGKLAITWQVNDKVTRQPERYVIFAEVIRDEAAMSAELVPVADRPGIVSTVLALSLDFGYRLSPRGESYLNYLRTR
jgi:hypothetical protein